MKNILLLLILNSSIYGQIYTEEFFSEDPCHKLSIPNNLINEYKLLKKGFSKKSENKINEFFKKWEFVTDNNFKKNNLTSNDSLETLVKDVIVQFYQYYLSPSGFEKPKYFLIDTIKVDRYDTLRNLMKDSRPEILIESKLISNIIFNDTLCGMKQLQYDFWPIIELFLCSKKSEEFFKKIIFLHKYVPVGLYTNKNKKIYRYSPYIYNIKFNITFTRARLCYYLDDYSGRFEVLKKENNLWHVIKNEGL